MLCLDNRNIAWYLCQLRINNQHEFMTNRANCFTLHIMQYIVLTKKPTENTIEIVEKQGGFIQKNQFLYILQVFPETFGI